MFQNTNKEVLKELAKDNYTSHKSRNRIAILAIALTTSESQQCGQWGSV